ncbi:MAG: lipoprotein-releasing ABC transporter permease subunit [Pseudomonadota bacterium]
MASFSRFIGFRYGFSKQRSRFSTFVSMASMLGMALGVASLITVLSVMNGFGGELRGRILALVPHGFVTVDSMDLVPDVSERVAEVDGVEAVAPYLRETLLLSGPYRQQGAVVFAIDPVQQTAVSSLERFMVSGNLQGLDEPFSVVLGAALARSLGVFVGDEILALLPQLRITPLGAFPRTRRLNVVGLFEVGAQQDSQVGYVSLETGESLASRNAERGLQLRATDMMIAPELDAPIDEALLGRGDYLPWSETQGTLFRAIRMEKITVALLLLSVVLVAAFNIVSTLAMAVTEKRTDIAVLRTMGATPWSVSKIFLAQGLGLALFGVLAGALIGVLLATSIADVVAYFEQLLGTSLFDPRVYYISRLPSDLQLMDVAAVVGASTVLSVLAVLYPAWRASRVAPAEVLRYE